MISPQCRWMPYLLCSLALLACQSELTPVPSAPVRAPLLSAAEISALDREYAGFSTLALTQSYLARKVTTLAGSSSGPALIREMAYGCLKHPATLQAVFAANPAVYAQVTEMPAVAAQIGAHPDFAACVGTTLNPSPEPSATPTPTPIPTPTDGPFVGEFRVNGYTVGTQDTPAIDSDASGNFTVVWRSAPQSGTGPDIYAQRYTAQGVSLGSEFKVNTHTSDDKFTPVVAVDHAGNTVIVWRSSSQDGSGSGIYAQRYNAQGVPQGSEFLVNTTTANDQIQPAIAMNKTTGDFIVAWTSFGQDGSDNGIYAKRYNSLAQPQGSEFQVNSYTPSAQILPAVAMDPSGNFIVTWSSYAQDGGDYGIYAKRYDAQGQTVGSEFLVNTETAPNQLRSTIAIAPEGDFIIAWNSSGQDGNDSGVYLKRYNAQGQPQTGDVLVNTHTTLAQATPKLAMDANGNFVVVWNSFEQDGSSWGVYGQRYNSQGQTQGAEFRVNTYTSQSQSESAITVASDGRFVVTWTSFEQDGDGFGVYAQRYNSAGVAQ